MPSEQQKHLRVSPRLKPPGSADTAGLWRNSGSSDVQSLPNAQAPPAKTTRVLHPPERRRSTLQTLPLGQSRPPIGVEAVIAESGQNRAARRDDVSQAYAETNAVVNLTTGPIPNRY